MNADDASTCVDCGSALVLSAAVVPPPEAPSDMDATILAPRFVEEETGGTAAVQPQEIAPPEPTLVSETPTALSPAAPASCAQCGQPLEPEWRFCKTCGVAVSRAIARPSRARHSLARIAPDGSVKPLQQLAEGRTVVGRADADLVFPEDGTLSGRHGAFVVSGATCEVADLGSTNGTFVAIRGDEPLVSGDVLLLGQRRLLYRSARRGHEVVEMLPGGGEGRVVALRGRRFVVGKDAAADMVLDDDHVSRRHAEIVRAAGGHALRDLGSTNRTYRIVTAPRALLDGDRVVMGGQVFEYRRTG